MIRALSSSSSTVLRRTDFRPQTFRLLHGPQRVDEYSETAMYPPISRYRTDDEKSAAKARDLVRECDTVEEKMYQINRPKYYGWWSYIMQPDKIPADLLGNLPPPSLLTIFLMKVEKYFFLPNLILKFYWFPDLKKK